MPHKQKKTVREKVRIARKCLEHKVSIREAARAAGVNREAIRNWINIYEQHGADGFTTKVNKHYSSEMKMAAVIDY